VANINVDEVLMLWPMQDVIAFGAEHSSLDAVIKKAAGAHERSRKPDPMPDESGLIRSDQYSFVKQGIPSTMPSPGFKSSDPKSTRRPSSETGRDPLPHAPDDMDQPGLDFDAAAKFAASCSFAATCRAGYAAATGTREIFRLPLRKSGRQVVGTLRSHLAMIRDLWAIYRAWETKTLEIAKKKKPKKPAPPKVHQLRFYSTNKPTTPETLELD